MDDDDDVEVVGERGACTTVAIVELDIWVEGRHSGLWLDEERRVDRRERGPARL